VVNLVIEVNRTQENPQVMKFKLELEDERERGEREGIRSILA